MKLFLEDRSRQTHIRWARQLSGPAGPATVAALHARARAAGGGAYLAHSAAGEWIAAPPEVAGLVLAGPRAGKTSCVVIPALLAHPGPVLSTSTKLEILHATLGARRALGRAWLLDLGDAPSYRGSRRARCRSCRSSR